MFCTKCGTKNSDDNAFCTNCGAKLNRPAPSASKPVNNEQGETTAVSSQNTDMADQTIVINVSNSHSQDNVQNTSSSDKTTVISPITSAPAKQIPIGTEPSQATSASPGRPQHAAISQQPTQVHKPILQQSSVQQNQPQPSRSQFAAQQAPVYATTAQRAASYSDIPVRSKSKNKIIIPVIIALVIIAAIVVTAFLTGGFGLMGVKAKSSVNEYTWEELSQISEKIGNASDETEAIEIAKKYNLVTKDGKLDGTQTKTVQLANGTSATVQIAGFAHDTKSSGEKAGITFIFCDAIDLQPMNADDTNSGGWDKSQLRSWLNSDGIRLLPKDLQNALVPVDKSTNNVGQTKNSSSISITTDSLWLFSCVELCGDTNWFASNDAAYNNVLNAEGKEYKLFMDCFVASGKQAEVLSKHYDNGFVWWWGRSPNPSTGERFFDTDKTGIIKGDMDYPSSLKGGVVPGFCI